MTTTTTGSSTTDSYSSSADSSDDSGVRCVSPDDIQPGGQEARGGNSGTDDAHASSWERFRTVSYTAYQMSNGHPRWWHRVLAMVLMVGLTSIFLVLGTVMVLVLLLVAVGKLVASFFQSALRLFHR